MERTEDTLYPDSREALSTQTFNQHGWAALIYRVKRKVEKKKILCPWYILTSFAYERKVTNNTQY